MNTQPIADLLHAMPMAQKAILYEALVIFRVALGEEKERELNESIHTPTTARHLADYHQWQIDKTKELLGTITDLYFKDDLKSAKYYMAEKNLSEKPTHPLQPMQ